MQKIGTSFATKLNILIVGIQLLTVIGVVAASSYSLFEDYPALITQTHRQVTSSAVARIRSEFQRFVDRALAASAIYATESEAEEQKLQRLKDFFKGDRVVVGVAYFEKWSQADGAKLRWHHAFENYPAADLKSLQLVGALLLDGMRESSTDANLVTLEDGRKILRLAVATRGLPRTSVANQPAAYWVFDVKEPWVQSLLADSSSATAVLTDARHKILSSNDRSKLPQDSTIDHSLETSLSSEDPQIAAGQSPGIRQLHYTDINGNKQVVFAGQIGFARMTVLNQVPAKTITAATLQLVTKAAFIAIAIFLVSLVLGYLLSVRIKNSILNLWVAAMKVAKGDYSTRLPVTKRTHWLDSDELQVFAGTFNEMVSGLEERSRVVALLSKLHGKELAEHLKSKRLNLGGERKQCIVLFSDIRGFTTLSENTAPELVVQLLNRYLTVMIKVIEANHGIVTGIQGDGIMAVWGLHEATEFAADAALNACFEMRKALNTLNNELISEGKSPIFMGMGLHHGPIIAGTIGSHNRMEFTAIGDTTNTASRIESATKEFGTDLLISETLLAQAKGQYVLEKIEVKMRGKQKPVSLFKVFGTKDPFGERHIRTPYSDYKPEKMKSAVFDEQFTSEITGEHPGAAVASSATKTGANTVVDLHKKKPEDGKKKTVRPRGWSG